MNKKSKVCYLAIIIFVLYAILSGTIIPITGQEMGYCILNYYLLLPILSFLCGLLLSSEEPQHKWYYILFIAIVGILMSLPVFHCIWWGMALFGTIPSCIGLIIGNLAKKLKQKL